MIYLPFKTMDVAGNYGACHDCGQARLRTATGAVCPAGHGRIVPVVFGYHTFAAQLPTAERVAGRRWQINGAAYRTEVIRPQRKSWYARRTPRGVLPDTVFAVSRGRILAFVPLEG